jgi:hypothetical protein
MIMYKLFSFFHYKSKSKVDKGKDSPRTIITTSDEDAEGGIIP